MKKLIIITISLCFIILSCEKTGDENSYCILTIKSSPETTMLLKSEIEEIKRVFDHNKLDYTKKLFTRFQKDEYGCNIRFFEFANNLLVFSSDAIFRFDKNDNYLSISGKLINTINIDTKPLMKQDKVVEKFIARIKQDEYYKGDSAIINGCFDIEFGY